MAEEHPERSTEERTFVRRRALLVVLLAVGAVALVAFAVMSYHSFTLRLEAARKLDRATTLVEDSDAVVVEVDKVVRAQVTPELAEEARGAAERVDDASRMLEEAIGLIDDAAPDLTDDERERAALLRESAATRSRMLQSVPGILEANAQAASALPFATKAWADVLEADALSDKAVAAYNKLTKKGVTSSQKLNRQAATVLARSNKRFESAESAFSAAPFETYLEYLATRVELNKLSQRSDKAWLADDITKANKLIAEYNKRDRAAAKQAEALPDTPEQAVADAYDRVTKSLTEAYYEARSAALKADQALRDY